MMPLMTENPKLLNFFIFNSKFGQEEGYEHRKLLYYYPKKESTESQVRSIGLAEAITRFTNTFNAKEDCESLYTQKTHQFYYQPEPDIWMVLTVTVGWVEKEKESGPVREYLSEGLQDQVLRSELIRTYKAFKLKHFTFKSFLDKSTGDDTENPVLLKTTLRHFFDEYLSGRDLVNGSVLGLWGDVSFLPLDKQGFLRVHSCLSTLHSLFPSIVHTAFLYRNNFVWCGFSSEDLPSLSQYLLSKIPWNRDFSTSFQSTASSNSSSSQNSAVSTTNATTTISSSYKESSHNARFLGDGPTPSEVVFVRSKDDQEATRSHRLVVFAVDDACVCLTFPGDCALNSDLFDKVARSLDSKLGQLVSEISEQSTKKRQPDSFRYLYHNRMNLATKSSLFGTNALPEDTMKTIVDLHADLLRNDSSELIAKTASDHWVVGRAGNGRESYVVVSHKNANLAEVTDEVNKMSESLFNNIFMIK